MENFNRLKEIHMQINLFYSDVANKKLTLEKKLEFCRKSKPLINEANQIITKMQNEISNLNQNISNNLGVDYDDYMIEILENPHANFNETLDIVKQLQSINQSIPTTTEIINDFENDTKFEKKNSTDHQDQDTNLYK